MTDREYLPTDEKNHGQPYPTVISDAALESMTKDRRFIAACHAMQGILNHTFAYRSDAEAMAKDAVKAADALLKELE